MADKNKKNWLEEQDGMKNKLKKDTTGTSENLGDTEKDFKEWYEKRPATGPDLKKPDHEYS